MNGRFLTFETIKAQKTVLELSRAHLEDLVGNPTMLEAVWEDFGC